MAHPRRTFPATCAYDTARSHTLTVMVKHYRRPSEARGEWRSDLACDRSQGDPELPGTLPGLRFDPDSTSFVKVMGAAEVSLDFGVGFHGTDAARPRARCP